MKLMTLASPRTTAPEVTVFSYPTQPHSPPTPTALAAKQEANKTRLCHAPPAIIRILFLGCVLRLSLVGFENET